jgi:glycerophosphoryl diester phosphodiesterase
LNEDFRTACLARPIAHRGFHDPGLGRAENSLAAARAAIAAGYAIECDVQCARDGGLIVFHDDNLDRLTDAKGLVRARDAADLLRLSLRGAAETIPSFEAFLAAIDGASPLVVEIKSAFDGRIDIARRVAEAVAGYAGPLALKSFDPNMIVFLRENARTLGIERFPLGIVAEAAYESHEWAFLSDDQRRAMTHFLHYPHTRPDFISWNAENLPHAIPFLLRATTGRPVMAWTVRSDEQRGAITAWIDQIVFEGFIPA